MSMLGSYTGNESTKSSQEANAAAHASNKKHHGHTSSIQSNGPPSPTKTDISIMFAEPETRTNSQDVSREGSFIDDSGRRRSKKSNRPKTRFSICHPPPTSTARQRLHRRPRSMIQLHRLSANARPKPAYEVIPSANFSVRLTKAITKVFKTKHSLCPNDLVILQAENYSKEELDVEQEARDIVALICKGRKEDGGTNGKSKICLPDGGEWEASSTTAGGYEFTSMDEHGLRLTVRWVPKKDKDGSKSTDSRNKFNFSTISPNSRKHPVIGCLSKTCLDINNTYKMPDPAAMTPLSTPRKLSDAPSELIEEDDSKQDLCETDDRLREIIIMTAIWVTFKEGWSPTLKADDKEKDTTGLQRSPSLKSSPSKSGIISPVPTPPGSPRSPRLEKRSSIKSIGSSIMRNSSILSKGNRGSMVSTTEVVEPAITAEMPAKSGRTRRDSTSTVLVHRAASNRRKNNQATWRPGMLAAQQQLQETSNEDLARAALPRGNANNFDLSPANTPQRKQSVAHPVLPSASRDSMSDGDDETGDDENDEPEGKATPTSNERPLSPTKRESNATTTTSTSASEPPRKTASVANASQRKQIKKGGWRRLLCGGGSDI